MQSFALSHTAFTCYIQIQIKAKWGKSIVNDGPALFSSADRWQVLWFMIKRGFIAVAVSELDFHHETASSKYGD